MCGVAGIIDFEKRKNTTATISNMLKVIRHRGPDDSGIYHSAFATFGNVRLSILDIKNGRQPISDSSGRYWIVYNGEVFNYKELRESIEHQGDIFKTNTDTEVIVHLFRRYGEDCLKLLNGQFVFAIWDKKEEELFIARDRVGIRPLFYYSSNGTLSFASEIKALFEIPDIPKELSPEGLLQTYTFWTTLTPLTSFRNIFELSPGHFLRFSRKGLQIKKYWSLDFENKNFKLSFEEATEELNELFTSSTRMRLRADVEVAAFLSGGIDSSATVSYIKKIEPGMLNTFSIKFAEKDFDESQYQEEAVKYFKCNHKSITCTANDIAEIFPRVVWYSETPMTRTAPAPMMMLYRFVRDNNIKAVITGEGSDELLAGYDIFRENNIRRFWASQPESDIRPLLLKKLYPDIPALRNSATVMLKMFFGYMLSETADPFYSHLLRWNNSNHIRKHLSGWMKDFSSSYSPLSILSSQLPEGFSRWDSLSKAQWIETSIFMSGYLLSTQGDRMGMSYSVEGRYPFLDYRIIEFCTSLPSDFKLHGLNEKYLLKNLTKGSIPESIRKRPKQPYRAPIKSVFLSKNPPEYVRYMLSEEYTAKTGIFDFLSFSEMLSRIKKTGLASEVDQMAVTAIISTHLLHYQFIENYNTEFNNAAIDQPLIIKDLDN